MNIQCVSLRLKKFADPSFVPLVIQVECKHIHDILGVMCWPKFIGQISAQCIASNPIEEAQPKIFEKSDPSIEC